MRSASDVYVCATQIRKVEPPELKMNGHEAGAARQDRPNGSQMLLQQFDDMRSDSTIEHLRSNFT